MINIFEKTQYIYTHPSAIGHLPQFIWDFLIRLVHDLNEVRGDF